MRQFNTAFVVWLLFFLSVNAIFLDLAVFTRKQEAAADVSGNQSESQPGHEALTLCPTCRDEVRSIVSDEIARKQKPTMPTETPRTAGTPKEFYIPLGSGITKSQSWEEIKGAEVYIDTNHYPPITDVIFESYLRIPTANGTVFAKLYNVTDEHDVWLSDVSSEGDQVVRREAHVRLDPGNKLYRLVMKSTLSYDAEAVNARIKIVTK